MKKFLSAAMALTMLFLTACGSAAGDALINSGDDAADIGSAQSIYEELTGLDENLTVMTVDGNEVPASVYLYWTLSLASSAEYEVQMYNTYYGVYDEMFNEDKTLNWDAPFREETTLREYVLSYIQSTVTRLATVENMAKKNGVTLTEEDLADIEAYKEQVAESYREQLVEKDDAYAELSSEEVLDLYLEYLGINNAAFDRLTTSPYYFTGLTQLVMTEGSALYLDSADYDQYGYYADHLLLSTMDTETYTSYDQSVIDEKRAQAEDILAQLRASDDPEALFAQLADEYSEDPGRETNPTGYVFGPGEMVAEFEEATASLQVGEISEIVQSNYGFHIILRRDLSEGLAAYPDQKTALAEDHLSSLISLNMDNAEVTYADEIVDFDFVAFYNAYNERLMKESASDAILGSSDDTTSEDASVSTNK